MDGLFGQAAQVAATMPSNPILDVVAEAVGTVGHRELRQGNAVCVLDLYPNAADRRSRKIQLQRASRGGHGVCSELAT
ncbi:MAG: hypothetical protein OTJ97_00060 [SAR202 cluster bacterium]|nr:hypothetical protein [SAR202 cluster bacterium]